MRLSLGDGWYCWKPHPQPFSEKKSPRAARGPLLQRRLFLFPPFVKGGRGGIFQMNTVTLALRLTLLDFLLRPVGSWFLQPLLLGLAAIGVALFLPVEDLEGHVVLRSR